MRYIIVFIISALFLGSCQSGKKFTSRKYMSGRYVSQSTHKERIVKEQTKKENSSYKIEKTEMAEAALVQASQASHEVTTSSAENLPLAIKEDKRNTSLSKKAEELIQNSILFNKKSFKKLEYKKRSQSSAPGSKSLISVFLSGAGLIINIIGFIMAIALGEYIFLSLLAIGLCLGIIGLVLGIQGIKEYKREKSMGNKNTSTLVLGIVGTAIGGVAIFTAIYLSFLGLLILSWA